MSDEEKTTEPQPSETTGAPTQDQGAASQQAAAGDAAQAELVETPESKLSALEAERDEIRDRMLRIAADFENYKKRVRREQQESVARAREDLLRDLLEVIDNLERALSAAGGQSDPESIVKGVNLVLRLFQSKLERQEVKPFEAKGQPFDPRRHEAISQIPVPDAVPGTVVTELQKGYMVGDRLLRPAIVAVATAPKDAQPTAGDGEPKTP